MICPTCATTIRIPRHFADAAEDAESEKAKSRKSSGDGVVRATFIAAPGEFGSLADHPEETPKPPRAHSAESESRTTLTEAPPLEFPLQIDETRVRRGLLRDRSWIVRGYACGLLGVGLLQGLPVAIYSITHRELLADQPLPTWAFVSLFASLLVVSYAVYLWQIPDWSALLVTSLFALGLACCYGFLAAGLFLGDAQGWPATPLQIDYELATVSPLWSGVMFGAMALISFVFGRDAILWQRSPY